MVILLEVTGAIITWKMIWKSRNSLGMDWKQANFVIAIDLLDEDLNALLLESLASVLSHFAMPRRNLGCEIVVRGSSVYRPQLLRR